MTRAEKTIISISITLVILTFFFNFLGNHVATAQAMETHSPTTKVDWSNRQAEECEKQAWKMLREEYSEVAAAAIMGNLLHESGFCPWRFESMTYEQSYELTQKLMDDENGFIYSDGAFGLAAWYGTTNKQRLWDYCEENGYNVYELEGQIRFLMEDYKATAPGSAKRINCYKTDEISFASEEFRQSYEKAENSEYGKYKRAKYAKTMYAAYCEDIYTISEVSTAPYNYDLSERVKALNKELGIH